MSKITIYKDGEIIAIFKELEGLILQRNGHLSFLSSETWIDFEPEDYDWFDII